MTDKAEERAREVLMIFYQEGYREGQANPSPAAVARVLREAATVLIEDCRKTNSQAHNDGTCQCEYDAAIIEAMIPESER